MKSTHHDTADRLYEVASSRYEKVKTLPYAYAERETLTSGLPDLTGKSVLDIGCGTGFYSRIYKLLGAARVVGVDITQGMIDCAREIEDADPLGIEYVVSDSAEIATMGEFDVVTPVWVFEYAKDRDEYYRMVDNCVTNLRPGGSMVALCTNPDIDFEAMGTYPRYGLSITTAEAHEERRVANIRLDLDPAVEFNGFFWPSGIVEESFAKAGLVDIQRLPARAPGHSELDAGASYWADFLTNPPFALFTATKPDAFGATA